MFHYSMCTDARSALDTLWVNKNQRAIALHEGKGHFES